ncbi:hypothetical protein D3C81_2054100 [compost metagenome]
MNFLHLAPIHIPTRFGILQPRQVRIGLHHRIDGLADGLLIDMLEIDIQPFHGFDRQVALRDQLALAQRFISLAFAGG